MSIIIVSLNKRAPTPEPGLLLSVDSFPSRVHYIELAPLLGYLITLTASSAHNLLGLEGNEMSSCYNPSQVISCVTFGPNRPPDCLMLSKGGKILTIFRQVLVSRSSSEAHHDPFNAPKRAIEISSYEEMKHGPTKLLL